MSGHSHWATTKRQKGLNDAVRGKLFSKMTKAITIAAKGGMDPVSNPKLRVAIEQAKGINMPKENIERAIAKASKKDIELVEVVYEGFGPEGIGIIIEAATDNRNRTFQEIKNIFEKQGGTMAGPGAVSFNFEPKGLLVVEKTKDHEVQLFSLIDAGAEDIEEAGGMLEIYVQPSDVSRIKDAIKAQGYEVKEADLVRKPKNPIFVSDKESAKKAITLLEKFEEHEDVQRVFTNLEVLSDLAN